MSKTLHANDSITTQFINSVCARLADNRRIRRSLPIWGRLHIDRQLPFLCVYRRPPAGEDAGTDRLVTSEASYLIADGAARLQPGLTTLVRALARKLADQFGAFLLLEVWSGDAGDEPAARPAVQAPAFRIVTPKDDDLGTFLDRFDAALTRVDIGKQTAQVEIASDRRCNPPDLAPILSPSTARRMGCHLLGLEVRPIYRHPRSRVLYPLLLRDLRRGLTRALRRSFYEFTCSHTTHRPVHYHMLGRRAMVKAVWEVDRRLSQVSESFDFLLQVTPVNAERAWRQFKKDRFQHAPVLHYRPLPVDPIVLKRRLYETPVEHVEDPALSQLFRQKQDELDRRITMLLDLNTKRFMPGSVQLFGSVDDDLLELAEQLLQRLPARSRDDSKRGYVETDDFVDRATAEIGYYRRQWSGVDADVEVRDDIATGLMVSQGTLLVGRNTRIPQSRVQALLQHEVGTHVVTYYNGKAQPFRQLYTGFAGYEGLQEGLAVLAEYLAGGLTRPRLRLLAARVVAARCLLQGATFVETFRALNRAYGFERRTAFTVTMRIHRGGGLTKDSVYLRGLRRVLQYLGEGGRLDPLFVGKIAADHIPIIRELQWRGVLREPPLTPRYMNQLDSATRLTDLRKGMTVLDLIDRTRS